MSGDVRLFPNCEAGGLDKIFHQEEKHSKDEQQANRDIGEIPEQAFEERSHLIVEMDGKENNEEEAQSQKAAPQPSGIISGLPPRGPQGTVMPYLDCGKQEEYEDNDGNKNGLDHDPFSIKIGLCIIPCPGINFFSG